MSTPQSESDPFPSSTLEPGLDETQKHSQVSFSFGEENQTRMQWIPLMVGCQNFSTYLENRLCCDACALCLTGLSFSAHHFFGEAANGCSTFSPFGLLALPSFCTFSQSPLPYLAEEAPLPNTFKQCCTARRSPSSPGTYEYQTYEQSDPLS